MTVTISEHVETTSDSASDAELLQKFTASRDEAAFRELIARHGPLVMGVCVRVLAHQQDAEDAFQAAFVVLAKRAGRIRQRDSLAAWLYGVAYRVSIDVARRRQRAERSLVSEPMHTDDPFSKLEYDFDRQVVDEELQRLPHRYRTPLILYYLGGKTSKEIAEELGTSQGSIDGRLKRGRQQLRVQLTRRGVALSGMLSVVCVSAEHATAAVSPALINSTVSVGMAGVTGGPLPADVSGEVLHVAGKEMLRMSLLKPLAGTLCAGLLLSIGAVCVSAFDGAPQLRDGRGVLDTRAENQSAAEVALAFAGVQDQKPAANRPPGLGGSGGGVAGPGGGLPTASAGASGGGGGFGSPPPGGGVGVSGFGSASRMNPSGGLAVLSTTQAQMATASATRRTQARIETELSEKIELPITGGESLATIVEMMSDAHDLTIVVDVHELASFGIDSLDDVLVSEQLHLENIRLANALEVVLGQTNSDEALDYIIENEVLKLTSRAAAEMHRETRIYSLAEVADDEFVAEEFLEVVENSVNFEEEQDVNIQLLGNRMVVRHNQRAHRVIADLMAQFRDSRQLPAGSPAGGAGR